MIRIRDLSVSFNDRRVLTNLSLDLEENRVTVIVGPSGSGKTTLLRAVNRLNELYPGCRTSGSVNLLLEEGEIDVYRDVKDVAWLRRRAAMVFQSPHVLPVSIVKNLRLPLELTTSIGKDEIERRIEKSLRDAELFDEVKERLHESALTLSGGQQQRLCLARALALEPSYLLLDEPTASLDVASSRKIEALLIKLKENYTIVAVSHSLGQASRIADRVIVLREGMISERIDREQLRDPTLLLRTMDENF